jgi:GNAT superfamily N-acetyltransferase
MVVTTPACLAPSSVPLPNETIVVRRSGAVVGTCSCWWRTTPPLEDARTGFIGHYNAQDAVAGAEVLSAACDILSRAGCKLAIGPINGSTWHSYRFIVDRGSEPAFFLEPDTRDDWPAHWAGCGFFPLATYSSAVVECLEVEPPAIDRAARRLASSGVSIRSLNTSRADEELRKLCALSQISFRRNFLYSPADCDEFRQQYVALLPMVRPELVLLAERRGDVVGFAFAVPDVLQMRRTGSTDTVILKTLAAHPNLEGAGLGGVLVARVHRQAHEGGYRRVIHALMHDENRSRRLSDRFARPIRRYALFAKKLGGVGDQQ